MIRHVTFGYLIHDELLYQLLKCSVAEPEIHARTTANYTVNYHQSRNCYYVVDVHI